MKGQAKVEFILGVVVFAFIIFYVASQINTVFLSVTVDSKLDILKSRSISLMDVLTKNSEMGLAMERGNLNATRIAEWANTTPPCAQLERYHLGGYRLTLYEEDEAGPVLLCGYVGLAGLRTNVVRAVRITNETSGLTRYGNMTIEMW